METNRKSVFGFVIIGLCVIGIIVGIILGVSSGSDPDGVTLADKPTLVEIGSTSCEPCQLLKPILEQIKSDYASSVNIKVYDAWNTTIGANKATEYGVSSIPTLIFLNANGQEVARMTGFHDYAAIAAKFEELGWV